MLRACFILRSPTTLSKATRLQLGNIKTPYGEVASAAGSHEKWGFLYRRSKYPIPNISLSASVLFIGIFTSLCWSQYVDSVKMLDHVTVEDVRDRCLTPIPGWARLRSIRVLSFIPGPQVHRGAAPLDWLPFEIKLGHVKQASV